VTALLELIGVSAYYGRVPALHDVDIVVHEREMVTLLGANGAGKTTTLRAISRAVRTSGSLVLSGTDLTRRTTHEVARLGVGHVPEGRGTFIELSVADNLRLGLLARGREHRTTTSQDLDVLYQTFPALADARDRPAGTLSGGQQQQLAIARALLGRPHLLLVDEPSLGLAPLITQELFVMLRQLQQSWDLAVLLAEQNARLSLDVADRAYVLESGRVVASGPAARLRDDPALATAYLGAVEQPGHEPVPADKAQLR